MDFLDPSRTFRCPTQFNLVAISVFTAFVACFFYLFVFLLRLLHVFIESFEDCFRRHEPIRVFSENQSSKKRHLGPRRDDVEVKVADGGEGRPVEAQETLLGRQVRLFLHHVPACLHHVLDYPCVPRAQVAGVGKVLPGQHQEVVGSGGPDVIDHHHFFVLVEDAILHFTRSIHNLAEGTRCPVMSHA